MGNEVNDIPIERRRELTFRQAEDLDPLPKPLRLKEISQELRAYIFYWMEGIIWSQYDIDWEQIASDFHRLHLHRIDGDMDINDLTHYLKNLMEDKSDEAYANILDFLQYILRHPNIDQYISETGNKISLPSFINELQDIFSECQAAYFIDSIPPITILPKSSPDEGNAIIENMGTLNQQDHTGALQHIRKAGEAINSGDWAGSVRESIHAVVSVVRKNTGKQSLKEALELIPPLHTALKEGLNKIYGYTSDEQGIRHEFVNLNEANVDEDLALFMYGSCASFAAYLSKKSKPQP